MALFNPLVSFTNNFNLPTAIKDVYAKVIRIEGSKINQVAEVWLLPGDYATNPDHTEPLEVRQVAFVPDMDGGNFIKQAYAHMKTLPEYSGFTDC